MKYESEALEVLHEHAKEMYKVGAITEARMQEYDKMCLEKPDVKQKVSSVIYKNDTSKKNKHFTQIASHA